MKSGKIELWLTLDVFDKSKGKTKSSHEMEFAMAEQDVDDACELMRQTTSQIKTARDDLSSAKKQRELRAEQELVHEQISILSPRGRRNPHARPGPAAPALYDVRSPSRKPRLTRAGRYVRSEHRAAAATQAAPDLHR